MRQQSPHRQRTWLFRSATIAAVLASAYACKTGRGGSDLKEVAAPAGKGSGTMAGTTFDKLDGYESKSDVLAALGRRIGCERAAQWVSVPASGSLDKSLNKLAASDNVYKTFKDEFANTTAIKSACDQAGGTTSGVGTHVDGFLAIYKKVRDAGQGLTFIMQGGFGSHLTPDGALLTTRKLLNEQGKSLEADGVTRPLRAWRIECSNSYAPDDTCSQELVESIAKKEQEEPSSLPHMYLFWGYSKGGNTTLQALGMSRELRNKTLALITVASPLGGGVAITVVEPALQEAIKSQAAMVNKNPAIAMAAPAAIAMPPDAYRKTLDLLTPENMPIVAAGAKSILPVNREKFFKDWLVGQDFSRDPDPVFKHEKIPVFHVASLVDVATLKPFPLLTMKNNQPIAREGSMNFNHFEEMALISTFKDYPLNDTCVALQHAVVPKNRTPANVETSLLGLLRLDHLSLQLASGTADDGANVTPGLDIVDAIIDAVDQRLEGAN